MAKLDQAGTAISDVVPPTVLRQRGEAIAPRVGTTPNWLRDLAAGKWVSPARKDEIAS